jgi:hypothetical protein
MAGEGTGISPFFEKLIVQFDPLLNLGKVNLPPHLTEEFSFEKFEGFALLKIGTRLGCPNSKKEIREPLTISIRDSQ